MRNLFEGFLFSACEVTAWAKQLEHWTYTEEECNKKGSISLKPFNIQPCNLEYGLSIVIRVYKIQTMIATGTLLCEMIQIFVYVVSTGKRKSDFGTNTFQISKLVPVLRYRKAILSKQNREFFGMIISCTISKQNTRGEWSSLGLFLKFFAFKDRVCPFCSILRKIGIVLELKVHFLNAIHQFEGNYLFYNMNGKILYQKFEFLKIS